MIGTEGAARELLRASLPGEWESALARARVLARQIEYLTWPDRAKCLDEFLFAEARARLDPETVTAVINRHAGIAGPRQPAGIYAAWCGTLLGAVLLLLDEPAEIRCPEHGLTCLLARQPELQEAATMWIDLHGESGLQEHLGRLPGYAFFLLAASPSDSARSFIARDAFWRAILG